MKRWLRALSAFPFSLPLAFEPAPEAGRFVAFQAAARIELGCDGIEVAGPPGEPPVQIRFPGARPGVEPVASDPRPGRVHRLIGRDAARWRTDLPLHGRIRCAGVHPGLDLALYGRGGHLEFDVIAAPGADLSAFRLAVEGADAQIDPHGDLALHAGARRLVLRAPVAYQESAGARRAVESRFVPRGAAFGFAVGDHDPAAALVVDPVLELSSYAGGDRFDSARAVALDADGFVLVAGVTASKDFPTTEGAFQPEYAGGNDDFERGDAFVMKLAPGGTSLVWATYLGGNDLDAGQDVAVGPGGDVFVAGGSYSKDFPVTPGALQPERAKEGFDAFVARLAPDGAGLVYSTYLGGKDGDFANAVAVDAAGNASVAGYTYSKDFPVTPGAFQTSRSGRQDAFVTRLAPDGSALLWSSFLGGKDGEAAADLALAGDGSAVVVGATTSKQFPVTAGAFQAEYAGETDAFVTRLSADGAALVWSSFLGGDSGNPIAYDFANGVALDAYESVYVVGETLSRDLPVTPDAFDVECGRNDNCTSTDAFAAKLSADGCALLYGTYLGDSNVDGARAVAVDARGHAHVVGFTHDNDFPVTEDAFQPEREGGADAFLSELGPSAFGLVYSTFFGSNDDDAANGVALGGALRVHLAGSTTGNGLPIVGPAFQPDYGTSTDGFVAVFGGVPAVEPALLASLATPGPVAVNGAAPGTLSVRNAGSAAADEVVASVTLGAGFAFDSATPSQGSCAFAAPVLTCTLGSLAAGAEAAVDYLATPTAGGVLASTAQVEAAGAESVRAGACLFAQVSDLAIASLKAPKSAKVPEGAGTQVKLSVQIENLGNHPESIADLAVLGELVTLELTPTGAGCTPPAVALDPKSGKKLPLELEPGKKLKVAFVATLDCAATDYLVEARVDRSVLDGQPDSVPANDSAEATIDAEPK